METELTHNSVIPERAKVLSGSALKMIAMVCMIVDHCGHYLFANSPIVLVEAFGQQLTLYYFMRSVGRLAFPIFVFLLVEGFIHTRSRPKYALRLAIFALISEIPWNLVHANSLLYEKQNVFFTLLLGLLGLMAIERFRDERPKMLACLLGLLFVSLVLNADYGCGGFGLVLVMYELRNTPIVRAVAGTTMLTSNWRGGLAFIPIALYNGRRGFIRGRVLGLAFYAIYPVHLLILWAVVYGIV